MNIVPVPDVEISPGVRIIVHVPVEGKPVRLTLPVGVSRVGCIMVPITGADGTGGGPGIITSPEGPDTHPASLVKVKLYVPGSRSVTVTLVPVPFILTCSGVAVQGPGT